MPGIKTQTIAQKKKENKAKYELNYKKKMKEAGWKQVMIWVPEQGAADLSALRKVWKTFKINSERKIK
jgi:hypothetical protein